MREAFENANALDSKALIITLWVFTRNVDFVNAAVSAHVGKAQLQHDDLRLFTYHLSQTHQNWKRKMHSRSRDYSINSASLDSKSPRWILRGFEGVQNVLLKKNVGTLTQIARKLSEDIPNFGPFLCQHLIWTFQLLGVVDYETEWSWSGLKDYCSTRNTLKLFKRFIRTYRECENRLSKHRNPVAALSEKAVPTTTHKFMNPLHYHIGEPSPSEAGVFMVKTFMKFRDYLDHVSELKFKVHLRWGKEKYIGECCLHDHAPYLRTWLNFCCNACMHEKVFKDYFTRTSRD